MVCIVAMLCILVAFAVLPAMAATALLALAVRLSGMVAPARPLPALLVGSVVPFVMFVHGLDLSWPWPWSEIEVMHDGLGRKGAWLVVMSAPAWLACLLVGKAMLGRGSGQGR